MTARRSRRHLFGTSAKIGLAAGVLASGAVVVTAQDLSRAPGGQRLTGQITQTLAADTNFELEDPSRGSSLRSTTTFALSYLTETQIESFRLDTDISLFARLGGADDTQDENDVTVTLPSLAARYTRDGARGGFEIGGAFRAAPVEFLRGFEVDLDDDGNAVATDVEDFEDTGTRLSSDADVSLSFGAEGGPAVVTFGAGVEVVDYRDVDDPDLVDNRRVQGSVGLDLKLSPVVDALVDVTGSYFEADDAEETERRRLRFGTGLDYAVNPRVETRLRAGIAFEEEDTTAGTEEDVLYDASIGIGYALPRTQFDADLGFATSNDDEVTTTGRLRFTHELSSAGAALTGALDRSLTIADDGGNVAVTGASLELGLPLDTVSSANFGAAYVLREELDGVDPDESRLTLSAGYTRQLSRRLSLTAGYAYSLRDEGEERADNHGVSLTVAVPLDF